ncbi:allantoicase [Jatrophihabitans sp. DSM 45814]
MNSDPVANAVDLASRWFGSSVLEASDESFGLKESLLTPGPAAFEAGNYDHRGEIVDGWETRRRRIPGHDWALIRLGAAGRIEYVDIDTSHFTGNYPTHCWVEACAMPGYPSVAELTEPSVPWVCIVPPARLVGDAHNYFEVSDQRRFTHVRLSIDPDGGVARMRVLGTVLPDPREWQHLTVELSCVEQGGRVVWSSDDFYTPAQVLIQPDRARNMGEGWETRRRRDDGHDSAVIVLAAAGNLHMFEADTTHFKYNASAEIALFGATAKEFVQLQSDLASTAGWHPLLGRTPLQPDTRHRFRLDPDVAAEIAAVRIETYPDGGLSRVRVLGTPTPEAIRAATLKLQSAS